MVISRYKWTSWTKTNHLPFIVDQEEEVVGQFQNLENWVSRKSSISLGASTAGKMEDSLVQRSEILKDWIHLKKSNDQRLSMAIVLALTLGLAPFSPPHIIGKVKWVLGGAIGMQPMDYFDLVIHGIPWLFLVYAVIKRLKNKWSNNKHGLKTSINTLNKNKKKSPRTGVWKWWITEKVRCSKKINRFRLLLAGNMEFASKIKFSCELCCWTN